MLDALDHHERLTATQITDALGLDHGHSWYRVALTLERLANDGILELKRPGSTIRKFRRLS